MLIHFILDFLTTTLDAYMDYFGPFYYEPN